MNQLKLGFVPFMRVCVCLSALLLISACDQQWNNQMNGGPALAAPDTASIRIAEAAEKAASSLDAISRVEQAKSPVPASTPDEDFSYAPAELQEPVTVTWSGPAERFLAAMASRAGYSFRTLGSPPPVTMTVVLDVYQQPLVAVIRSASLQLTGKADVIVDSGMHVITLQYAANRAD